MVCDSLYTYVYSSHVAHDMLHLVCLIKRKKSEQLQNYSAQIEQVLAFKRLLTMYDMLYPMQMAKTDTTSACHPMK